MSTKKSAAKPATKKPRAGATTPTKARKASTSAGSSSKTPRLRASHADGLGTERATPKRATKSASASKTAGAARAKAARALPAATSAAKRATKRTTADRGEAQTPRPSPPPRSQALALAIAAAGIEKKAINVEIIDVTGRIDYTDFLVVMTGRSDRHVHAIAQGIDQAMSQRKEQPLSIEGLTESTWVLLDFNDVVVHVFQEDTRRAYDLEGMWMDASRVPAPAESPPRP